MAIAATAIPALLGRVRGELSARPALPAPEQLRLAVAITNRTLSYLG